MHEVDEETFRNAKPIIDLLKENLTLWKEDEAEWDAEDLWVKLPTFYTMYV